ncbi:terminus macrodomain insulation protein YfbV [Pseudoalteromonas sp. SSDWG2]|uniref:terminus macrodomain insulation protein YfbV n=1 Tax=Pseudoalteromonas sp. SSDWG2 TaxID=3139391 RepID=UPI003BA848BD
MLKSLILQMQQGYSYAKLWPARRELAPIFPENRVTSATLFAAKVMPAAAITSLVVQLQLLGPDYAGPALAFALLILSLPAQGLLWLGKRATSPLPPSMAVWYKELYSKMVAKGYDGAPAKAKPRYVELAQLLKDMFEKMDKAFRQEFF